MSGGDFINEVPRADPMEKNYRFLMLLEAMVIIWNITGASPFNGTRIWKKLVPLGLPVATYLRSNVDEND